jgi:uncharacterized protein YgiM (DUF1202 family)
MWHRVRHVLFIAVAPLLVLGIDGCSAATDEDPDSEELSEDTESIGEGVSGSIPVGTELVATGNVNLRSSASTSGSILQVVASGSKVTVVSSTPSNGFYKVKLGGTTGWSSGKYYEPTGGSSGSLPIGTKLTSTADVNLRSGPSTSNSILDLVPKGSTVTVAQEAPSNGFYKVDYQGTIGWSSGKYYGQGDGGQTPPSNTPKIDAAMARAKAGKGFSYWWGHGRWRPEGVNGNAGSCSGSCPSCSHSGSYGADCSGYVAKIWQVPSSNSDITSDSHPYSTADFDNDTGNWSTVSRSNLKTADAMVYRSGGAGHIFLYEKGDGWGSMYAYECKGCSYGCIAGYRTASSSYHGIRRAGY